MHIELTLPAGIEIGPAKRLQWDREVVTTDGGHEVRNSRWSSPLRAYDISLPVRAADHPDFVAVQAIWRKTEGGTHSFNLTDWIDEESVRVRFDDDLSISTPKRLPQHHIDTFTLVEVRDVSPTSTVAPAITGTLEVGETLSVGTGTWSGSPTSYTYQWLRDGAEISGATSNSRVLLLADLAAMMSCDVTAIDADGGDTLVTAAAVGPVLP